MTNGAHHQKELTPLFDNDKDEGWHHVPDCSRPVGSHSNANEPENDAPEKPKTSEKPDTNSAADEWERNVGMNGQGED